MNRLIVALDTADLGTLASLVSNLSPLVGGFKIGLETYLALSVGGYRAARDDGLPIMLDLKFHDIPNTVAGAVRAILPLRPWAITVHASGGKTMIKAASDAVVFSGHKLPLILAVTALTSLTESPDKIGDLAVMAIRAGADGIVCSPVAATTVRDAIGPKRIIVTPGIRLDGSPPDDQMLTATPRVAIANGADYLVVGRPITQAEDPVVVAKRILEEMDV